MFNTNWNITCSLYLFLGLILVTCSSRAGLETYVPAQFDENLRFTADFSARVGYNWQNGKIANTEFIGFDLHKVFSGSQGDWGTLLLQGYLTRIDNIDNPPFFFDDNHDWEFLYRFFFFNYTGLAGGRLNIRIGHFEIPFGLEQIYNTNGTLYDFTNAKNLGIKADWGFSVNGELPDFEYEVSLTRGSGNEIISSGNPYVVAGRIGTSRYNHFILGLSGFYGEIYRPSVPGSTLKRTRLGVDASWYYGPIGVLGEFSFGENDKNDVVNGYLEINWHDSIEIWTVYSQLLPFSVETTTHGWRTQFTGVVGWRYEPDNHWSISSQVSHDFVKLPLAVRQSALSFQLRYRF